MTSSERTKLKNELRQALSEALRQLREKLPHKPTQEILAGTVGMDRSYWGDLERGERSLTLFNLWRMALALGVSPSRLVLAIDKNYRRIAGVSEAAPPLTPIQEALKKLRDFMDQSPEMKWLGSPYLKTLHCNPPMLRYLGLPHLEGQAWKETVHPDDLAWYVAKHAKALSKREPHLSRYRMRGGDGRFRLFLEHAVPQFTGQGIFVGYLGTMIEEPENSDNRPLIAPKSLAV